MDHIPVIDLGSYVEKSDEKNCKEVADALEKYGCLVVKDPRVDQGKNDTFLSMMERYFEQSDGILDARPELHYQIGVTPSMVEVPRNHCDLVKKFAARSICPPRPDQKWRFFWRVGPRPEKTEFPDLNAADEVVPEAFQNEWAPTMNAWGEALVDTATTVSEMAALGFGLSKDTFAKYLRHGPHLLAPTGSDLSSVTDGTILAGFHADLNFLTVHGKCRYPGLTVFCRDGTPVAPKVPDGYLLVQAGKQLEYLSGGRVLAGFHEVIVNPNTLTTVQRNLALAPPPSIWRVSSTCFVHVASDNTLEPLLSKADDESKEVSFPPIKAGLQVKAELEAINLAATAAHPS